VRGLPRAVRDALQKARDSALLAVEVYNKPAVTFKSAGYITLIVIAWGALFHAIFHRRKVKPYYRKESGRYVKIEGDYKHWELDECLRQYYGNDFSNPVRKNLEFFIPLRNKIEHRSVPELDANIFGECQAMLLNFDDMLLKEFGEKYCIRQCLSFALQFYPSTGGLAEVVRRNRSAKSAAEFIEGYRTSISNDVLHSGKYAFKAFLIQVANHESKDAMAIQFVHYDTLTEEQKKSIGHIVALVKYKHVPVANADTISAGEVARRVQEALGNPQVARAGRQRDKFTLGWHIKCWQHFKVRPQGGSPDPEKTDAKFCIFDSRHNDYGYTEEWVKFLVERFRDEKAYEELYPAQ